MLTRTLTIVPLLLSAVVASAQPAAGPRASRTDRPLVLVGCLAPEPQNRDRYIFSDAKTGTRYRLSGKPVAIYEGRRIRIVGGLYPSPNVAAQAGAIDPAQSAIVAQPGGAGGTGPIEFTITKVRPVPGACPPR